MPDQSTQTVYYEADKNPSTWQALSQFLAEDRNALQRELDYECENHEADVELLRDFSNHHETMARHAGQALANLRAEHDFLLDDAESLSLELEQERELKEVFLQELIRLRAKCAQLQLRVAQLP